MRLSIIYKKLILSDNIKLVFKFILSSLIFYFLWRNISVSESIALLNKVEPIYLIIGAILPIILLILMTLKWAIFIKSFSDHSMFKLLKIYWAGDFLSLFNFGTIGGEAYKMISFPKNKKKALAASLVDKIYSFYWYILLAILLFFSRLIFPQDILISISITFILYIILAIFTTKILSKLSSISSLNKHIKIKKILVFINLEIKFYIQHAILSFIFVFCTFLMYSTILYSVGVPIDFNLLYYIPVLIILLTLPISIQGIGVREYVLILYATNQGVDQDPILIGSILILSFVLFERILGVIPFLNKR